MHRNPQWINGCCRIIPLAIAGPPKVVHKTMDILNDKLRDTFLWTIEQNPIWKGFFYSELTTGLRLGELCGLKWDDLNFRAATLVERQVN